MVGHSFDVSAVLAAEEQGDHALVTVLCGNVERGVTNVVLGFNIGAVFKEFRHRFGLVVLRCYHERRMPLLHAKVRDEARLTGIHIHTGTI